MSRILKDMDPLKDLYNIENMEKLLDEEEKKLLNLVFNEFENLNQITDSMENLISNNVINDHQLKKMFKTIQKVVYYKVSLNTTAKVKKGLVRTFFELPEIISKKIHLFLNRNLI